MAYPKEQEHIDYMKYVEQWSNGEGERADKPKMTKEQWRARRKKDDDDERSTPKTILGSMD